MISVKRAKKSKNGASKNMLSHRIELLGVLLTALFLFLLFSLVSYNPADPSLFYWVSNHTSITNWCGALGANAAASTFYFLGSASYVLLFALFYIVSLVLVQRSMRGEGERVSGVMLFLVAFAPLCTMYNLDFTSSYPGGLLGDSLAVMLAGTLGKVGSLLVLYSLVWMSVCLSLQYSILGSLYQVATFAIEKTYLVMCMAGLLGRLLLQGIRRIASSIVAVEEMRFSFLEQSATQSPAATPAPGMPLWQPPVSGGSSQQEEVEEEEYEAAKEDDGTLGDFFASVATAEPELEDEVDVEVITFPELCELYDEYPMRAAADEDYELLTCRIPMLRNTVALVNPFAGEAAEIIDEMLATDELQEEVEAPAPKSKKKKAPSVEYKLPDLGMFAATRPEPVDRTELEAECREQANRLEEKLNRFGVKGTVTAIRPGPVITMFEYEPDIDTKISRIIALEDDLALALRAMSIRIVAPIPGRSVVGFEISNPTRENVLFSDLINHEAFAATDKKLPMVLGVDVTGHPVIDDLVTMPHLLVAGSTGSGKSVGLNAMIMSMLCKMTPDKMRMILVDPKRLEFAPYADIPHLLFPIVTDPRKVSPVLKWVVGEMERRYDAMALAGVRNLGDYHGYYEIHKDSNDELEAMPYIVLIIDELADLMMVAGKEVEGLITRIAQMARAAGIHMIVATQRPSVDVVTGIIKVNFPSRIGFKVSSKIDSKTILDGSGAEKLLGRGDMLCSGPRTVGLARVHGAYVSDQEINTLAGYLREQYPVQYLDFAEVVLAASEAEASEDQDDLYSDVREHVSTLQEVSISMLQRRFRIGFNRSARLIEQLEGSGVIAPAQGSKPRKVLH